MGSLTIPNGGLGGFNPSFDELRDKTSDAADQLYQEALSEARCKAYNTFNEFEMSDCLCDRALLIAVLGCASDEQVGALVKKLVGDRIEANAEFMAEMS